MLNCFARYQLRGSNLVCILKLTELDALEVPEKFMVVGVETNFWVSSKELDKKLNEGSPITIYFSNLTQ